MIQIATYIMASLSVVAQIATVVLLVAYFSKASWAKELKKLVAEKYLWLGFLVSFGAVVGSLFYSEVAGYSPCNLCWLQRIFIYPQAIIFAVALAKKKKDLADYSLWLSGIGGMIAIYNHYLQLGGSPWVPCSADSANACAQRFIMAFGYITLPLLAFSAFALLFVSSLIAKKSKTNY